MSALLTASWRHAAAAAAILAVALTAAIAAGFAAERGARRDAQQRATIAAIQVEDAVAQASTYLESVRRFLVSRPEALESEFSTFATDTLGDMDLANIAWIERVTAARRAAYERRIGRQISASTPGWGTTAVGERPVYYPASVIARIRPDAVRGVDLGVHPQLRAAVRSRAAQFGPTASAPLRLPHGQTGFFFVESAARSTPRAIRPGFVVAFVPTDWLESAVPELSGALQLRVGGRATGATGAGETVSQGFTAAARRWDVVLPVLPATGAAAALPWTLLGAGALLAALTLWLGVGSAARRRAQQDLDRAFALSRDLVCTSGFDGRLRSINPAFERTLGYTREELLSRPFIELLHVDDVQAAIAELEGLRQGGEMVGYESRVRHHDGSYRWIEWTGLGSPAEGRIYSTGRDVTERKRAEEERRLLEAELRQSQRLEAIGQLAGGVAHDFNNLVTGIIGYSELVLDSLPADAEVRPDVEDILRAGQRAQALTSQLLAFSRQAPLSTEVVDLNEVVGDLDRLLRRLIGEHIAVRTELAPELLCIDADRAQLERVIVNLVVNARDAMADGGTLTIGSAAVELDEPLDGGPRSLPAGRYVCLTIADTGIGMDAETRRRAFEPFFTTKGVGAGTGLGLAGVWGIVEQLGGRTVVDSEPGRGATFTIYLPTAGGQAPVHAEDAEEHASLRGTERVLLVEDDPMVADLAARVLRDHGYDVMEADRASVAIELWNRCGGQVDVLVSDVVMPGASGIDLAQHLLAERPGLSVVLMSGYVGDPAHRPSRLPSGSIRFLDKPFVANALLRTVRDAVEGPPLAELERS